MVGTLSRDARSHRSEVRDRLAHIRLSVARTRHEGQTCGLNHWGDHFNNGADAQELNDWGDHFNNGANAQELQLLGRPL